MHAFMQLKELSSPNEISQQVNKYSIFTGDPFTFHTCTVQAHQDRLLLPLMLVLLAMAAGASSTEDGPAIAKSDGSFLENPVGRKLLQNIKFCGADSAPDYSCKVLANNATCCTDGLGNQGRWDVGFYYPDKCGSCTTTCKLGEICCRGVCADPLTDKNNCGICGNKCLGNQSCKFSLCGYWSFDGRGCMN